MKHKLGRNLIKSAQFIGMGLATGIELVLIDLTFGKSKYRKHGARMRPIIHRTVNHRTVIIQQPVAVTERVQR